MVTFQVNDMTCGHCASAISRAVASVDKTAHLDVRIQDKLVRIDSQAPAAELARAMKDAGYTPQQVRKEPVRAAAERAASGCGCGCGPRKPAAVDARQPDTATAGSCCS